MKKSVVIEHVSIEIESNFDSFTFRLEKTLGVLAPSELQALGAIPGSMARYLNSTQDENKLVLFNIFSYEDLTDKGSSRKIKQYQVGNAGIMVRMMAKHSAAGLYFPIKLLVYEKPDRKVVVEYYLPSSLFGRINNAEIFADALILEDNLSNVIQASDKGNREDE